MLALSNDASDRRVGDREVLAGSDEHTALLHGLLGEVLAIAERHDGRLAVLALPPLVGPFVRPGDEDGRRELLMRDAYRSFQDEHPEVVLLDLAEEICPGTDCGAPPAGFDPAWRYDGLHFDASGARWVASWMTAELRASVAEG